MESSLPTSKKLLLVDDDEAYLRVLGGALQKRGFEVFPAQNMADGLSLAKTHRPDFSVIDLKLENESGLDLISGLKTVNDHMVIVLLTGYASIATAVEAIKRGASNYLSKPVKVGELVKVLTGKPQAPACNEDLTPMSVERLEWEHIQKLLQENDGNISATARSLGMYRRTLQRKLAKRPVKK